MTPLPDEAKVVARAQQGDPRAFERLYRAYAKVLYARVLVPMLGDRDDAKDCLRDTFIAAHRALPQYRWQPSGIYGWLRVLARNKARDCLRAAGRRTRLRGAFEHHLEALGGAAPNWTDQGVQQQQLRQQIEAVLSTMNERYAKVLRLRLLEDRPRDECARQLDVKVATLDVLFFRACKAFRAACDKQGVQLEREVGE